MADRLTIATNLENVASTQYLNHPFSAAAVLDGRLVFFGETGIFEQTGATDDGTPIDAFIDLPLLDFGERSEKSIEAIDVGYESTGNLELRLTAAEATGTTRIVPLPKRDREAGQQGLTQSLRKAAGTRARYHQVRLANTDGCDFSLDFLALAPVFYRRRNQ